MAYPILMILWQIGKTPFRCPAPTRLLTKELLVVPKELTITKKRVETLRVMLDTASSIFPKCSMATKNRNHGAMQSGVAFDLKIADIARDGQLLQYVRDVANRIVDEDPTGTRPENAILWRQLQALRKTNINWAAIS